MREGNVFTPVCLFTDGMMSLPVWSHVLFGWVGLKRGRLTPTPADTAAGGTHPTGMHSYCVYDHLNSSIPRDLNYFTSHLNKFTNSR